MSAAASAVSSGDWTTARNKADQALALLSVLPKSAQEGFSQEWSTTGILAFIQRCETNLARASRESSSNSVFGTQKVKFANTTD